MRTQVIIVLLVLYIFISILLFLLTLAPFVNLSVDTFPGYGESLRFVSFSLCSHLIVNTFIKLQILSSFASASPELGGKRIVFLGAWRRENAMRRFAFGREVPSLRGDRGKLAYTG